MSTPTRTRPPQPSSHDQAGAPGKGPFYKDMRQTPPALWIAVLLMCLGVALVGGGVIALSLNVTTALLLFVIGTALGLVGLALGLHNNIMTNVE